MAVVYHELACKKAEEEMEYRNIYEQMLLYLFLLNVTKANEMNVLKVFVFAQWICDLVFEKRICLV